MNKVLPTGAVIKFNNTPFLIIGYQFLKTEDQVEIGYSSVMYPLGMKDGDSVVIIPEDKVGAVIYCPDKLKNSLTELLQKMRQDINQEGWESVEKQLKDFVLSSEGIGAEQ